MFADKDGEMVHCRTQFNYCMDDVSRETGLRCEDETRAQQQFKEETDINVIVERFGLTGELPQNGRMPIQEEFVEVTSYQEALNKLMEADREFMTLPAAIRAEFQNDPGRFVEFASDKANLPKLREWGMARPEAKEPEPMRVRVIPEDVPKA